MSARKDSPTNLTAAIDWFTATSQSSRVGHNWYELFWRGVEHLKLVKENGCSTKAQTRIGYEGIEADGMFWGRHNTQGFIFIAWGIVSNGIWQSICPTATRVSRLDLAVTVELGTAEPNVAKKAYKGQKMDTQRQYAIVQSSKGGQTLYVGSRSSNQFGRLYDKGKKDYGLEPGKVWRYEVEIKDKPRNNAILESLMDKWRKGKPVPDDITSYVHRWFSVRGVRPRFFSQGLDLPKVEVEVAMSSNDRKLKWLRQQVAPTVKNLIEQGLGDNALKALGLEQEQLPFWHKETIDLTGV